MLTPVEWNEKKILASDTDDILGSISKIRSDLRDLKTHYTQLLDLSQELEENENEFFDADNERYFHLVSQRVETLYDIASSYDHIDDLHAADSYRRLVRNEL